MYKSHLFTFLLIYILSNNGWNLVQTADPGQNQAYGAQQRETWDIPFKLIDIEIKDKRSTSKCHYECNPSQRSETFTPYTPYLIDKVTKRGRVIWNSADFKYYGARVLLVRTDSNELVFRVLYPGFQDEEESKPEFQPELEYVMQGTDAGQFLQQQVHVMPPQQQVHVMPPQQQVPFMPPQHQVPVAPHHKQVPVVPHHEQVPGIQHQQELHIQPELPKPAKAPKPVKVVQHPVATTHEDMYLPETEAEDTVAAQPLKVTQPQKQIPIDTSDFEVVDGMKGSRAKPRPAAAHPVAVQPGPAHPVYPEVQELAQVQQRVRRAGGRGPDVIPLDQSGTEQEIPEPQQRKRKGPQPVEAFGQDFDAADYSQDARGARTSHTAYLPPTESEEATRAKGTDQSQLAAETQEFDTVLVKLEITNCRNSKQVSYEHDSETGAHVFTPNPGHAIYMATHNGKTVWRAKDERYPTHLIITIDENNKTKLRAMYDDEADPNKFVLDVRDYWDQAKFDETKYDAMADNGNIIYFFKEGVKCTQVTCDKIVVWKMGEHDISETKSVSFDRVNHHVVVSDNDKGLEYHYDGQQWTLSKILQYESDTETEMEQQPKPTAKAAAQQQQQQQMMGVPAAAQPPTKGAVQQPGAWPEQQFDQVHGFEVYESSGEVEQAQPQQYHQAPLGKPGRAVVKDRHAQYPVGPDGMPLSVVHGVPQQPAFTADGQVHTDVELITKQPGVPVASAHAGAVAAPMPRARASVRVQPPAVHPQHVLGEQQVLGRPQAPRVQPVEQEFAHYPTPDMRFLHTEAAAVPKHPVMPRGRGALGRQTAALQPKLQEIPDPHPQPIDLSTMYFDENGIPVVVSQDSDQFQHHATPANVPVARVPVAKPPKTSQFQVLDTESDSYNLQQAHSRLIQTKKGVKAVVSEIEGLAPMPSTDPYLHLQEQSYQQQLLQKQQKQKLRQQQQIQQQQLQQQQLQQQQIQQQQLQQQQLQQQQLQQQQLQQQQQQPIHAQQQPEQQHLLEQQYLDQQQLQYQQQLQAQQLYQEQIQQQPEHQQLHADKLEQQQYQDQLLAEQQAQQQPQQAYQQQLQTQQHLDQQQLKAQQQLDQQAQQQVGQSQYMEQMQAFKQQLRAQQQLEQQQKRQRQKQPAELAHQQPPEVAQHPPEVAYQHPPEVAYQHPPEVAYQQPTEVAYQQPPGADHADIKAQKLAAKALKQQQMIAKQQYVQQLQQREAAHKHYAQQYTQQYAQYSQQYAQKANAVKSRKQAQAEVAGMNAAQEHRIAQLAAAGAVQQDVHMAYAQPAPQQAMYHQQFQQQQQQRQSRRIAVPEQQAQVKAQRVESQPPYPEEDPANVFEGYEPPQEDMFSGTFDDLVVVDTDGDSSNNEQLPQQPRTSHGHVRAQPIEAYPVDQDFSIVER